MERQLANIYRALWLSAEHELQELRQQIAGEILAIELDIMDEVGEELEAKQRQVEKRGLLKRKKFLPTHCRGSLS